MERSGIKVFAMVLLTIIPMISSGQRWKSMRNEVFLGIGASNFLGELGGSDDVGGQFLRDIDFASTRPTIAIGYRYQLAEKFALRSSLIYGTVSGSDEHTEDFARNGRNLHFKSPIVEFGVMGEFMFLSTRNTKAYRLLGARGQRGSDIQAFVFGGVAGFYFNPKAKAESDGKWHNLRDLGTEGQGLPGGPDKYSTVSISLPVGIGLAYNIDKHFSIRLEYGSRKTFTDYIDDVSTDYYDPTLLAAGNGELAAELGDPNTFDFGGVQPGQFEFNDGDQRGNPDKNDHYFFGILTINYKFSRNRFNVPKF